MPVLSGAWSGRPYNMNDERELPQNAQNSQSEEDLEYSYRLILFVSFVLFVAIFPF
jgi:hypothetical protein